MFSFANGESLYKGLLASFRMSHFRHINFQWIREEDLLDFIEQKHHAYSRSMLELIIRNFQSALKSSTSISEEFEDTFNILLQLQEQVSKLIDMEEKSLFPFIRKLLEVNKEPEPLRFLNVNLTGSTIRAIRDDHSRVIALLHSLRKLTNNYKASDDAPEIHKLVFAELEEFDQDFIQHLHREKEYLFPKMISLEEKVVQRSGQASMGNQANWNPD
jgi:regulator of cell morphogenesis and NO signaling